eukprot:15330253-Ditylum_brightwellii.AAC.1
MEELDVRSTLWIDGLWWIEDSVEWSECWLKEGLICGWKDIGCKNVTLVYGSHCANGGVTTCDWIIGVPIWRPTICNQ